jgi:GMP synthase (glutamine-hydrolysing)
VQFEICEPYVAQINCDAVARADAFVFTGSGVSWSTDAPEAAPLRRAGSVVLETGKPVIGSCNGLQLAAVLLGGTVRVSPSGKEIALARDLMLTDAGREHAMMAGRVDGFCVPCMHRDEVERMPEGAVLLARNGHSPVQAMSYVGNGVDFWGMQYHPEMTLNDAANIVASGVGLFGNGAPMADDLRAAETDAAAAARLGVSQALLRAEVRTLELGNWLAHVRGGLQ